MVDKVLVCVSDGVRSNLCSQIDWFFPQNPGCTGVDDRCSRAPSSAVKPAFQLTIDSGQSASAAASIPVGTLFLACSRFVLDPASLLTRLRCVFLQSRSKSFGSCFEKLTRSAQDRESSFWRPCQLLQGLVPMIAPAEERLNS